MKKSKKNIFKKDKIYISKGLKYLLNIILMLWKMNYLDKY